MSILLARFAFHDKCTPKRVVEALIVRNVALQCKAGKFPELGTLPDARSHAFSDWRRLRLFFTPIRHGQAKFCRTFATHCFIVKLSCGPGSDIIAALISIFNFLEFREHPDHFAIYHIDFQGRYASNTVEYGCRYSGQLVKHPSHDVIENTLLETLLKTSI